ncbi:hypothetical protein S40285_03559 [Stachybotrys chlorohalonatus IBT 40285]|uniref:Uncharacterized protein n=1 Tax=Stachybotrys chlorohalonatus (strain IBT 40285) TaxID=1283841 RepID=A0A084QVI9_STAC4|nr:hypothetical protein S40285_03559 [Stachybotrys chlorohalonata IBT 40285]
MSTIYVFRHAESEHNVSKDFSHRDPPLTPLGLSQAAAIPKSFPHSESITTILTSPLTRTVQTTLAAFSHILHTGAGARLVVDPNLQERSALPCDTGSDRGALEQSFPGLDWAVLGEGAWFVKEGAYAADDAAVAARAGLVRRRLKEIVDQQAAGDVVVVTHGVFMKFLVEDETIDLPKAGWKAFKIGQEDGDVKLIPVD